VAGEWQRRSSDRSAPGDSEGFDKADREFFVGLLRGVLASAVLEEQLQLSRSPFSELSPIEACVLLAGAFELAITRRRRIG
jgi:transcription termination factor NusB